MARNLVFDDQRRATGVNVTVNGIKPGTLHNYSWYPALAPGETLECYNIPVISDLPGVGQNSWDTCDLGGPSYRINVEASTRLEDNAALLADATEAFLRNATGPLTSEGGDFLAWEKLPAHLRQNFSASTRDAFDKFPPDWPELELVIGSSARTLTASTAEGDFGSIGVLMTATTSRGNMTIQSASNDVPPVVNPGWLTTRADQEMAVAGHRRAREGWERMAVRVGEEMVPGAKVTTDAQLLDFIQREGVSAIHHVSSTCAMGKVGEAETVVDAKARVIGVVGLRVIDSSSFPFTPPGHTQGTTYAHAVKLVQDVIEDNTP